jgi:G3E family GTPase
VQAVEQVAFADRILLNKVDLVGEDEKQAVVRRIKVTGTWRLP